MTFALMFLSKHGPPQNMKSDDDINIVMIGVLSIPSVNFGICKDAAADKH